GAGEGEPRELPLVDTAARNDRQQPRGDAHRVHRVDRPHPSTTARPVPAAHRAPPRAGPPAASSIPASSGPANTSVALPWNSPSQTSGDTAASSATAARRSHGTAAPAIDTVP